MNSGSRCARCSCVEKLDALDLCIGFMLVLDDLYTDRKRARRKEQERYDRSRGRHRDLCAAFAAGEISIRFSAVCVTFNEFLPWKRIGLASLHTLCEP